jgi:hypothetical protein
MADIVQHRGKWTLLTFTMQTRKGLIQLAELQNGVTLHSGVHSPTISGTIKILDRADVLTKYDITGGEEIILEYQVSDDKKIKHKLMLTRISDEASETNESAKRYVLDVASADYPKFLEQYAMSFTGLVSGMIDRFFKTKIASHKKLDVKSTTQWPMHFVTNMWTGFNTVDFLASRAYSTNGHSGFHFYETWESYEFANLADEFEKPPVATFIKKEETNPNNLTYSVYDQIKVLQLGSYDDMINSGYSSTAHFYDHMNKSYIPKKVESHPFDRQTINSKTTPQTSQYLRFNYNKSHPKMTQPHLKDILQKRNIEQGTFEDVRIEIRVHGHSVNKPGMPVVLKHLDVEREEKGDRNNLDPIQGKYIIETIIDTLGDEWIQTLTLKKFKKVKA